MIKFAIVKSKLVNNPTGYVGRVQPVGTVDFAGLVDRVADSQTSVAKSDVLGVLEDYHRIIEKLLRDGMNVLTPHVCYRAGIRGTFQDEGDGFDSTRHRIVPRVITGSRLRAALDKVAVELCEVYRPEPRPQTYVDAATGQHNAAVTPGASGRLVGRRMQFDPTDSRQGIFFVDAAGGEARVASVGWNMRRNLVFTVPALAAGEYCLEVRAILNDNHELRVGKLEAVLVVS